MATTEILISNTYKQNNSSTSTEQNSLPKPGAQHSLLVPIVDALVARRRFRAPHAVVVTAWVSNLPGYMNGPQGSTHRSAQTRGRHVGA